MTTKTELMRTAGRALATPTTRNVLRVYREASEQERRDGARWYAEAFALAAELDPADPERGAAVIAVVSPLTPWRRNVEIARRAYALRAAGADVDRIAAQLGTLPRNARKAAALVWGAEPSAVVTGAKVSAFWHTIAHPDDARAVVIDRHAFDVAVGRVTDDETRGRALARRGGYAAVADCYVRAARILSRELGRKVTAAEVQAVTWSVWRARHAHHMARAEARADARGRRLAAV